MHTVLRMSLNLFLYANKVEEWSSLGYWLSIMSDAGFLFVETLEMFWNILCFLFASSFIFCVLGFLLSFLFLSPFFSISLPLILCPSHLCSSSPSSIFLILPSTFFSCHLHFHKPSRPSPSKPLSPSLPPFLTPSLLFFPILLFLAAFANSFSIFQLKHFSCHSPFNILPHPTLSIYIYPLPSANC